MLLIQNDWEQPRGWSLVPTPWFCWTECLLLASSNKVAQNHSSNSDSFVHHTIIYTLLLIKGESF
jgi:hypothetical protein